MSWQAESEYKDNNTNKSNKEQAMDGYIISFDKLSTLEFKDDVITTVIKLHNQGYHLYAQSSQVFCLVAELTKSVFRLNHDDKTATFTYVGI